LFGEFNLFFKISVFICMGRFTKVLVFLLSVQVLFGQTVFAFRVDDEGPKPWTQYASDHMHS